MSRNQIERIERSTPERLGWGFRTALRFGCAALLALAATPALAQSEDDAYRINNGDLLRIEVTGRADLSGTVTVNDQGDVAVGTIGSVRATGRTTADLAADLARRISLTQRETPQVRVTLVEARGQRIFVLGSVILPGAYTFRENPTVWDAISEAGGPTDDADLSAVEVIPSAPSGDRRTTVDVAAAIRAGNYTGMARLKPGDTIRVPRGATADAGEGQVVYVMGAVAAQGPLALLPPNDLISTVVRTGPSADADLSRVQIVRRAGGRIVQMHVNARDYLSAAQVTGNPRLEAGDTVYVPRSKRFNIFSILGIGSVVGLLSTLAIFRR